MTKLRQDIDIGGNFRELRRRSGLRQEDVVAQLYFLGCKDVTRSLYSRYETGELNVKVSHLRALKQAFKCSYDDLLDGPKS